MLTSRFFKSLSSAFFLLLIAAPFSFSQITNITDDQTAPLPGAGHNYTQAVNETVNPANGSVSFRLDTGVPKGRGLTVPLTLAYDSNGAAHAISLSPQPLATWVSNMGGMGGWSFLVPSLTWSTRTLVDPHNQSNVCNHVTDFVFQDSTGGRHFLGMLGQLATSNDCAVLGVPTPVLSGSDDVYWAVATSPAAGLVMVTDHFTGTAYSFNTNLGGSYPATGPRFIEDRNGNRVSFNPAYSPGSPAAGGGRVGE